MEIFGATTRRRHDETALDIYAADIYRYFGSSAAQF
jgi:hypothetical protein